MKSGSAKEPVEMGAQFTEADYARFTHGVAAFNAGEFGSALELLEPLESLDGWLLRIFPYLHEVRLRLMSAAPSDSADWMRLKNADDASRKRLEVLDGDSPAFAPITENESVRSRRFDAELEFHSADWDLDDISSFEGDFADQDSISDGPDGGGRVRSFRQRRRSDTGQKVRSGTASRADLAASSDMAGRTPARIPRAARIERTPHIGVGSASPLRSGDKFEIEVYLDSSAPLKGEQGQRVVAESGSRLLAAIFTSSHFSLSGEANINFVINAADLRTSLPAVAAKVTSMAEWTDGVAFIGAIFFADGRPVGHVTRQIEVEGHAAPAVAATENLLEIPRNGGPVADLTVTITADPSHDGRSFWCFVSTPHIDKYRQPVRGPWNLQGTTQTLVNGFMTRFTAAGTPKEQLISELKGVGKILFDSSPDVFREVFWAMIDSGSPMKTIAIVSAEPFVPWELMIPYRSVPAYSSRKPLGVEFAIGRWTDDKTVAPAWSLRLVDSSVIAPAYSGTMILKNALSEANMVVGQFPGEIIRPAKFVNVEQGLGSAPRTLIHFVCHGKDTQFGIQCLRLDNDEELSSSNILGIDGLGEMFSTSRPVVFLNACEVGRTVPSLVGLGGFVSSFIKLGATAVIAPLWSVEDKIAHEIAVLFYQEIRTRPEQTIAEIFKKVRAKGYDPATGRDTYVAYCFYGDPNAKVAIDSRPFAFT
jgi:CHAT domain